MSLSDPIPSNVTIKGDTRSFDPEVQAILEKRMRELSVQATNDTNGVAERSALHAEFDQLRTEINRIANTTQFNGFNILDGGVATGGLSGGVATFHVGADGTTAVEVSFTFNSFSTSTSVTGALMSNLASLQLYTGGLAAITSVNNSILSVDTQRASMGALINRFQYTVDNLTNVVTNASASRSRIVDADYSLATAELAKRQIIQQAATSMLAQANQQPQAVLTLLK